MTMLVNDVLYGINAGDGRYFDEISFYTGDKSDRELKLVMSGSELNIVDRDEYNTISSIEDAMEEIINCHMEDSDYEDDEDYDGGDDGEREDYTYEDLDEDETLDYDNLSILKDLIEEEVGYVNIISVDSNNSKMDVYIY